MTFKKFAALVSLLVACGQAPKSKSKDAAPQPYPSENVCVMNDAGPIALTDTVSSLFLTSPSCKSLEQLKTELDADSLYLAITSIACDVIPGLQSKAVSMTLKVSAAALQSYKLYLNHYAKCEQPTVLNDAQQAEVKAVACATLEANGMHCGKPGECQTADSIKAWVSNQNAPEGFCFHTVVDQTRTLKGGNLIPNDHQLRSGLQIAFLNREKNFADTQTACASIVGGEWRAPLSHGIAATPQSMDTRSSLENIGLYMRDGGWDAVFWSSSTDSTNTNAAWLFIISNALANNPKKTNKVNVLCVLP